MKRVTPREAKHFKAMDKAACKLLGIRYVPSEHATPAAIEFVESLSATPSAELPELPELPEASAELPELPEPPEASAELPELPEPPDYWNRDDRKP